MRDLTGTGPVVPLHVADLRQELAVQEKQERVPPLGPAKDGDKKEALSRTPSGLRSLPATPSGQRGTNGAFSTPPSSYRRGETPRCRPTSANIYIWFL